jgi:hypothetical protein
MPAPLRPSKKPTLGDQHDLIDEEAYADFFNDVYFADIVDGLSCGADANAPADYREHSVGGGCYYVPHPQKDTTQAPNRAIDSAVGTAQPTITPAPAANSTKGSRWGNSTIDPYAIPPQDETFLTDELVPPPGLAPTYYAEVEDGTAWLWTFFTTVSSELTTSMSNGVVLEDESDPDLAVLVWATPNATEATTTSSITKSISAAGKSKTIPTTASSLLPMLFLYICCDFAPTS